MQGTHPKVSTFVGTEHAQRGVAIRERVGPTRQPCDRASLHCQVNV